jgi:putative endonuclease
MIDKQERGAAGEAFTVDWLRQNGYYIVERNWRYEHYEVDIIATRRGVMHFVEVKTRNGTGCGFPEEAVDAQKRRRYERIAEYYLREYEEVDISICFDVIGIVVTGPHRAYLRFHVNAFASG